MKSPVAYLSVAVAAVLVSGGCMKLGPDYHRPDAGIQVPASYQRGPRDMVILGAEDQWWDVFGKPELSQLVEEALRKNLDIKKATARILEVRSQLVQTRADRFPNLSIDGTAERRQRPIIGIVPGKSFSTKTDTYTLSLPASFELDLWGRLARSEEAARADLLQAEENRCTVAQTVVAESINLQLQLESIERRIQIALESIENFRRSLALVESRYKRGLTSVLDVRQARRILAGAEALLPGLREELGITVPLNPHFKFYFEQPDNRCWGKVFSCIHEGPFVLQAEEVESGEFADLDRVTRGEFEPVTPDTKAVLERYLREN